MAGEAAADYAANGSTSKLHIFFFPFLAPGHTIPMTEIAKLCAVRGVKSTLLTTPYNEPTFQRSIESTQKLGFDIGVVTMKLPLQDVGLPEHCQSIESVSSPEMIWKFVEAVRMLDKQLENLIKEHRPDCVVSDLFLPWTLDIVAKFGIPRIVFHGLSHFGSSGMEYVRLHKPHSNISSDFEPFLIPDFPGEITMTRAELPDYMKDELPMTRFNDESMESEVRSYGVIMNSFYELEPAYADFYRDVLGRRTWCVGPLMMSNQDTNTNRHDCLKWLDSKETDSVIYICFGSMTIFTTSQLHDIAVGLEASGQPFVWVVKKDGSVEEGKEEWLPQGFEERMQGKGMIIRGWAPQVMILNHRAVGGFVTHCGWNSTLESICAGVPMVTWPVGAEQFFNQKFIIEVLRIGIPVGVKRWVKRVGDTVESEKVANAVRRVLAGKEAEDMRVRARELSVMAKEAVEKNGSPQSELTALLEDLKSHKVVTFFS